MDGIEKIIRQIIAEAEADSAAAAAEAKAKADEIIASYEANAEAVYARAMDAGRAEIDADALHIERNASLGSRKAILAVKQELVNKAFSLAEKKLRSIPRARYIEWLASMAAEAASGGEEMIFDACDADAAQLIADKANEKLAAKGKAAVTVSEKTAEIGAGFILRRGDVTVNCSAEELLELARKDMTAQAAAKLFG